MTRGRARRPVQRGFRTERSESSRPYRPDVKSIVDLTRRQVQIDGIVAEDAADHRADRLDVDDGVGQDATRRLLHGQAVPLGPDLQPPHDLAVQAPYTQARHGPAPLLAVIRRTTPRGRRRTCIDTVCPAFKSRPFDDAEPNARVPSGTQLRREGRTVDQRGADAGVEGASLPQRLDVLGRRIVGFDEVRSAPSSRSSKLRE